MGGGGGFGAEEKYKLLDPQRRKSVRCEIRPLDGGHMGRCRVLVYGCAGVYASPSTIYTLQVDAKPYSLKVARTLSLSAMSSQKPPKRKQKAQSLRRINKVKAHGAVETPKHRGVPRGLGHAPRNASESDCGGICSLSVAGSIEGGLGL